MEEIYGPEDIEKLLLSKDFSELYPEERAYVLKHMDDEVEYNAMRMMLLDVSKEDDVLTAPASMRDELIAMHESKHSRPSFKIWLNSLFSSLTPTVEWPRPAFQLAGVIGIVLIATITYRVLLPDMNTKDLAQVPQLAKESTEKPKADAEEAPVLEENERKVTVPQEKNSDDMVSSAEDEATITTENQSDASYGNADLGYIEQEINEDMALDNAPTESPAIDDFDVSNNDVIAYSEIHTIEVEKEVVAEAEETYDLADEERTAIVVQTESLARNEESESPARDRKQVSEIEFSTSAVELDAVKSEGEAIGSVSGASAQVPSNLLSLLYTAW